MQKFKSGFVSIIGRTNVRKSTLSNSLVGEKVASMANKTQTTRTAIRAIVNRKNSQIVFIDTPGIHKPKNKLGNAMIDTAFGTISEVDVILFMVEATSKEIGRGDSRILEKLKDANKKVILIINKIDLAKKENVASLINLYSREYNFDAIIPISALKNKEVETILEEIEKLLKEGPVYYNYVEVEKMKESRTQNKEKIYNIEAIIYCLRDSHKGIIIGKNGQMLKKIGTYARRDLEKMFGTKINLKTWVKVKKDWQDEDSIVKNFKYN